MALDMQAIYVLASGGSRAMEQLDTVTNNLANVNTTGFKKMLIKEMSQRLDENGSDSNHLFVFPRFEDSLVKTTQGALRQTQNRLDFAIEGSGYFVVQGKERFLTRNGHFLLNEKGYLVDAKGHKVLAKDNNPIQLEPKSPFSVTQEGSVVQNGEEVAKLAIRNYEKIKPVGESYYKPDGKQIKADYKVHQGFLEGSNVNPIIEMVDMINAQRRSDIYMNMIKSIDQLNQKTNEIAKA